MASSRNNRLSQTEAHGGHINDVAYDGKYDDHVVKTIRERLREHKARILNLLQEKLTTLFIQHLLSQLVLSPVEFDQIRKKQKRIKKASCLIDIISRKPGSALKVFVETLKEQCPGAYNMLHVQVDFAMNSSSYSSSSEYLGDSSFSNYTSSNPSIRSVPGNTNDRPYQPSRGLSNNLVHNIERAKRIAIERLNKCLQDKTGLPVFLCELKSVISSGVDIQLVTFTNGNSIMHEIVRLDLIEYLTAVMYAGCWNNLYRMRSVESGPLTPIELAKKLKKTKMIAKLDELNDLESSLHVVDQAVRAGNIPLFRELKVVNRQYIVRKCGDMVDSFSLLDYACQSGDILMLLDVIRTEQDCNSCRDSVDKAAALCVNLGHHLLLQPLKDYITFNPNNVIADGKRLIEHAAVNGDVATFQELTKLGASPSDTVIALAAGQNRFAFLDELFRDVRVSYNMNFQDRRKKTALHFAAEKGNVEIVNLLIANDANMSIKDKRNFTVLHAAVSSGSLVTVEAVMDACRRNNTLQNMLNTRDYYLGSERCFLVRGRDNEHAAWHYVEADRARIDIFRRRTQGGAVDVAAYGIVLKSGWGNTPSDEVVQEIEGKYDIANIQSDAALDQQPLHVAIMKNHEDISLKLIGITNNINQPDRFGLTPLHLAAMRDNVNVIKALLEKGADCTLKDDRNRTPYDIAEANDHPLAMTALNPVVGDDETEIFRNKVLLACEAMSKDRLNLVSNRGQDTKLHMKRLLRELVADVNDFLYDSLGEGPIASETTTVSDSQGFF